MNYTKYILTIFSEDQDYAQHEIEDRRIFPEENLATELLKQAAQHLPAGIYKINECLQIYSGDKHVGDIKRARVRNTKGDYYRHEDGWNNQINWYDPATQRNRVFNIEYTITRAGN